MVCKLDLRRNSSLPYILKFKVEYSHRVSLVYTHLLQLVDNAGGTQYILKILQRRVIIHIRNSDYIPQPVGFHKIDAVLNCDLKLFLGKQLSVQLLSCEWLSLKLFYRRQLTKLLPNCIYQFSLF